MRAAALLAVLAGAARAAVETHEVHASGSFGLLRRKHVNPERRLQTDYAPSAAPSEAPTFETWQPTAGGAVEGKVGSKYNRLGSCETYNAPRYNTYGVCEDTTTQCLSDSDCTEVLAALDGRTPDCDAVANTAYDEELSSYTCGVTKLACEGYSYQYTRPGGGTYYANYNTHDWSAADSSRRRNGCCVCELGCDHSEEDGDKGSICLANVGAGDDATLQSYVKTAIGVLVNADASDLALADWAVTTPSTGGCDKRYAYRLRYAPNPEGVGLLKQQKMLDATSTTDWESAIHDAVEALTGLAVCDADDTIYSAVGGNCATNCHLKYGAAAGTCTTIKSGDAAWKDKYADRAVEAVGWADVQLINHRVGGYKIRGFQRCKHWYLKGDGMQEKNVWVDRHLNTSWFTGRGDLCVA